jgi:D-inositol-3-phosphate glycosyltransferase
MLMPVRIGLVVPSIEQPGGVRSVAQFLARVAKNTGKFHVEAISLATSAHDRCNRSLFFPKTWMQGVRTKSFVWDDIPCTHVGANFGELEYQRFLPRSALQILLQRFDLLQVVAGSPAWASAVTAAGKPVSLQVATRAKIETRSRQVSMTDPKSLWRHGMTYFTDSVDDRALRSVNAIQVENPWMLEYVSAINAGRNDVDIRYAPPGINIHHYHPLYNSRVSGQPYILSVGRLDDYRKNIRLLAKAFSNLPPSLANVHLVTAGAAAPPAEYWSIISQSGYGERVSHVAQPTSHELLSLYRAAAVFVLPSDEEGLGVALLEAMACGVPVISTRSGGPDGIISDGEDGYLIERDDVAALTERLVALLSNDAMNAQLGRAARKTVEKRFSEEVTGAVFVDIWDSLLRK